MFEWIIIALVIAAIFYAGDLPKLKSFLDDKTKLLFEKAKEKKTELENQIKNKSTKGNNSEDSKD